MIKSNPRRRSPEGLPTQPPRRSGANDNRKFRIVVPPDPRRLARYGKNVLRLNPFFRLAGDALNILELFQNAQSGGWENLGAWTKYAQCGALDITYTMAHGRISAATASNSGVIAGLANGCTIGQAVTAGTIGNPWSGVTNSQKSILIGRTKIVGTSPRAQAQEAYTRPANGAFPLPSYREAQSAKALPRNRPEFWAITANPALAKPNQAPAFTPPVPWRQNKKWQAPNRAVANHMDQLSRGYIRAQDPAKVPNDWSLAIELGGQARPFAPKTHEMVSPTGTAQKPVKEKKAKLSPAFAFFLKAVSAATESLDFVDAIYDAIPIELRPRYRDSKHEKKVLTPLEKAQAIFDNLENIDLDRAMINLIAEQAEDRFYGTFGKMGGEISKRLNISYGAGLNSVGSKIRRHFYDSDMDSWGEVDGEN